MREILTAQRLREALFYDPETGVFIRRVATGARGCHKVGSIAGSVNSLGYVCISLDGKKYGAHRLAWLYVHGDWPAGVIDHRNGVRNDNRLGNLRDVTQAANVQNSQVVRSDNHSSGIRGVEKRGNSYRAKIQVGEKVIPLGSYQTAEEASRVYWDAKRRLHPGATA